MNKQIITDVFKNKSQRKSLYWPYPPIPPGKVIPKYRSDKKAAELVQSILNREFEKNVSTYEYLIKYYTGGDREA